MKAADLHRARWLLELGAEIERIETEYRRCAAPLVAEVEAINDILKGGPVTDEAGDDAG